MAYSDDYLRLVGKKAADEKIGAETVRKILFDFLNYVPEDLRWDIFNLFFPEIEDNAVVTVAEAQRLSLVVDLFEGEYEDDGTGLTDAELRTISEGVNDFALEMSDDVLMNVMKTVVARGLLG